MRGHVVERADLGTHRGERVEDVTRADVCVVGGHGARGRRRPCRWRAGRPRRMAAVRRCRRTSRSRRRARRRRRRRDLEGRMPSSARRASTAAIRPLLELLGGPARCGGAGRGRGRRLAADRALQVRDEPALGPWTICTSPSPETPVVQDGRGVGDEQRVGRYSQSAWRCPRLCCGRSVIDPRPISAEAADQPRAQHRPRSESRQLPPLSSTICPPKTNDERRRHRNPRLRRHERS